MASDDNMTIHSYMHEDEDEDDHDHDHDQHHPHNLSRLSMCTSSSKHSMNDFDDGGGCGSGGDLMMMFMSGLSIESSYGEGEADEEFSDDAHKGLVHHMYGATSDSDKDMGGSCLSLPGTPEGFVDDHVYCSENEAAAGGKGVVRSRAKRNSRRRAIRERWLEREWEKKKDKAKAMNGESEITRCNSGKRPICMDLGEVKACRDLGFELENQSRLEMPHLVSCSTIDTTSSGGNSPIASWRISSPGDDPKDVKARLKVWAQAVAASASRLVG